MIKAKINLLCMAGSAKPSPKLGQSLGPLGINMMQFCKDFNEKTSIFNPECPIRVRLTSMTDRTYSFKLKPPPTSWFIKRILMQDKLAKNAKAETPKFVGIKYIYEIAKIKKEMDYDLSSMELESICSMIINQCKSMGVEVMFNQEEPKPYKVNIKI